VDVDATKFVAAKALMQKKDTLIVHVFGSWPKGEKMVADFETNFANHVRLQKIVIEMEKYVDEILNDESLDEVSQGALILEGDKRLNDLVTASFTIPASLCEKWIKSLSRYEERLIMLVHAVTLLPFIGSDLGIRGMPKLHVFLFCHD
jgi:hypothetical protein